MRTDTRPAPPATATPPGTARRLGGPLLLSVLIAYTIFGLYFFVYHHRHVSFPFGWDTTIYIWQSAVAGARGLAEVTLATRPGHPLLLATLSGITGASPFHTTAVLVPLLGGILALATASVTAVALGPERGRFLAVAAAVGIGYSTARMMAGLHANLLNETFLMAALVPLAYAVEDRRGSFAAIVLLFGAGVSHWVFFVGFGFVLLLVDGYFFLRSRITPADPFWAGATRRLTGIGAASALAVGGTLFLVGATRDTSGLTRVYKGFKAKFRDVRNQYKLAVVGPLAALGLATIVRDDRAPGRRRFVRATIVAWLAVTAIGIALYYLGAKTPPHRILIFAPLPLLAGLGVYAVGRLVGRWIRVLGVAVAVLLLVSLAASAYQLWYRDQGTLFARESLQLFQDVGAYLETLPPDAPAVILMQPRKLNAPVMRSRENTIRAVLPPDRILTVRFYWGSIERYRAGLPDPTGNATFDRDLQTRWEQVQPLLPQHPPTLVILGVYDHYRPAVTSGVPEIVPGVALVQGPPPPASFSPATFPPTVPRFKVAVLEGLAFLLVLFLTGIGWAIALLPRDADPLVVAGVSPALGAGFLVIGALVVQATPLRLAGAGGWVTFLVMAGSGGLMALRDLRRRGDGPAVQDGRREVTTGGEDPAPAV